MQLIIPMAGRSSRFPGVKPKWMLTHPCGTFMGIQAIQGLNLSDFACIHFIYLCEHEEEHGFLKGFRDELEELNLLGKSVLTALSEPTVDQPETILKAIELNGITGPILIKDSDNFFTCNLAGENGVCFGNLNECGLIKPNNKSYVELSPDGHVINIVEKQVVSANFCVGGYAFRESQDFVAACKRLPMRENRFISNVIFQMILDGSVFAAIPTEDYCDWGTIEDWGRYQRSYATLFVDLDGTLFRNSSAHFPPYIGNTPALEENISVIRQLQESGKFEIIVTTSRPERYREKTESQLQEHGIRAKCLVMGLQHSKRIIINDYSKTNPYKSCDAINLKRDSDDLREILRESLGIEYEDI